ncbi:polyadenylate-binding protein RBP47-like protein, partial [Tanacetum coccineum]
NVTMRSIQSVVGSCSHVPQVASIKLIRNNQTGQSERYVFSEFLSHEAAEKVLQTYNGTIMPNTDQAFRLNWSSFSTGEKHADNNGGSYLSIFIEDLAPDATDTLLRRKRSVNTETVDQRVTTETGRPDLFTLKVDIFSVFLSDVPSSIPAILFPLSLFTAVNDMLHIVL